MLTIHKTYEGELRAKKEAVYVADGEAVKKVKGAQLSKFYEGVVVGSSLLSTSSNPKDVSIIDLLGRGIQVYRAHWHSTGIPKGLEPEEIALRFSQLPESQLQLMRLRPEILQLGQMVAIRQAFVEHRKADVLRLGAIRRAAGIADGEELPPDLKKLEQEINTDERKFEIPIDKKIAMDRHQNELREPLSIGTRSCEQRCGTSVSLSSGTGVIVGVLSTRTFCKLKPLFMLKNIRTAQVLKDIVEHALAAEFGKRF